MSAAPITTIKVYCSKMPKGYAIFEKAGYSTMSDNVFGTFVKHMNPPKGWRIVKGEEIGLTIIGLELTANYSCVIYPVDSSVVDHLELKLEASQ